MIFKCNLKNTMEMSEIQMFYHYIGHFFRQYYMHIYCMMILHFAKKLDHVYCIRYIVVNKFKINILVVSVFLFIQLYNIFET